MKPLVTSLLVLLPLFVAAQEFYVADFILLEPAAINEASQCVDYNGEYCALIKIVTKEKGFSFDGGSIGIEKVDENHDGLIWVYVPAGLRRISISHEKYGVISNYFFPIALAPAMSYEMILKTPNSKSTTTSSKVDRTPVSEGDIRVLLKFQTINIDSTNSVKRDTMRIACGKTIDFVGDVHGSVGMWYDIEYDTLYFSETDFIRYYYPESVESGACGGDKAVRTIKLQAIKKGETKVSCRNEYRREIVGRIDYTILIE